MDEVLVSGRTTSEHWMDRLGEHFSLHRIGADGDPEPVLSRTGPTFRVLVSGGGFRIGAGLLERLPNLRLIVVTGAGFDQINLAAARARDRRVQRARRDRCMRGRHGDRALPRGLSGDRRERPLRAQRGVARTAAAADAPRQRQDGGDLGARRDRPRDCRARHGLLYGGALLHAAPADGRLLSPSCAARRSRSCRRRPVLRRAGDARNDRGRRPRRPGTARPFGDPRQRRPREARRRACARRCPPIRDDRRRGLRRLRRRAARSGRARHGRERRAELAFGGLDSTRRGTMSSPPCAPISTSSFARAGS